MVVELGEGNDIATISTQGFANDSLNLTAGDGHDTVEADSFYGTGVYRTADSGQTWNVDLGDGNDLADIQTQGFFETSLKLTARDGDDTVHATVLPSVTDLVLDPFNRSVIAIDSGAGDDDVFVQTRDVADLQLDVLTGAGDDTVVIDPAQSIVFVATGEGDADIDLDLGDGDDMAEISIDGYFNVLLGVRAGTGDDEVGIKKFGSKQLILQGEGTYSGQHVDLGSGNDRLVATSQDVIHDATIVDAGDGNDTVETRSNVTAVYLTVGFFEVTNDVKTGAGDDKVSIQNEGVTKDNTRVDTGAGNDTVEFDSRAGVGILKSTDGGATNLGTVTFTMTLGSGADGAKINTIGYGEVNGLVDAGDGDDTVESNSKPPPPPPASTVAPSTSSSIGHRQSRLFPGGRQ